MLQKVMADLAEFLEHEDRYGVRSMPGGFLPDLCPGFGLLTVAVLLTVVLPAFSMLQECSRSALPTLILPENQRIPSSALPWIVPGLRVSPAGLRWYIRSPRGAEVWVPLKLRLPVMVRLSRAALSRFARTLGTLVKSGVSRCRRWKIVENTIGTALLAKLIRVGRETRGGILAAPLRKLGFFPKTVIQMIACG